MAPIEDIDSEDGPDAIAVLYGSQTSTAEEVAWDLVREGRRRGFRVKDPQALNDVDLQALASFRFAIFAVATTGQGDPPNNMRLLWKALLAASIPQTFLKDLRFAVFGLGDSHYREFNYAARKLFARLKQIGAEPFTRLGLGDDQHDFGFEQELDPWAEDMWTTLAGMVRVRELAPGVSLDASELRYEVEELPMQVSEARSTDPHATCRSVRGQDDFEAIVVGNQGLCSEAHTATEQDVRNVRFVVPTSYQAGDVLVVWPQTDATIVHRFIVDTLGLNPNQRIRIRPVRRSATKIFPDAPLTLRELFTSYVDISAIPARHFFQVLGRHSSDELHQKKLNEFASRTLEAKDALYEYCKRERRSVADVMWDFWTARPPLVQLLSAMPLVRPRRYSIASCPGWYSLRCTHALAAEFWAGYQRSSGRLLSWKPLETSGTAPSVFVEALRFRSESSSSLDLCVGVVTYITRTGREGQGLCSSFLQKALVGSRILCSFERGTLQHPPLEVPLLFVCPGTGLSPCRALIQERHLEIGRREASSGSGRFAAGLKDLIFLGFRHQNGDFLYGSEWSAFNSWLDVHVAFSRDQTDRKVYVQDKIEEYGAQVCRLLDAGARVYVCGRSHPMPTQVFDAFAEVLHVHRGLSLEDAASRLREMQRAQRYICDTWG